MFCRISSSIPDYRRDIRIFIDTFFRYVSDRRSCLSRRNEGRFWTRSAGREDANLR